MNKIDIKYITNIKNIYPLLNIVYNNFKHLSEDKNVGHNEKELKRLLSNQNFIGLFAYNSDNKIIGYLIGEKKYLNDGRYVFYISYVYVCKKYQGKKLGSRLIEIIINKMTNIGIKFIILTFDKTDIKLQKFYGKYGFVKDKLLNQENSNNQVVMLYL